jgi:hypothetical protein
MGMDYRCTVSQCPTLATQWLTGYEEELPPGSHGLPSPVLPRRRLGEGGAPISWTSPTKALP